jgi:hypothetical protein
MFIAVAVASPKITKRERTKAAATPDVRPPA